MKAAMQVNPGQPGLANYDPVPEISRKHFEEALKSARKSVTSLVYTQFKSFIYLYILRIWKNI